MKAIVLTVLVLPVGLWTSLAQAAAPAVELKVNSATLIRSGEPTPFTPAKDRFGPGQDGLDLVGAPLFRAQALFPCSGVAEGDYCVGVPIMLPQWIGYMGFGEFMGHWLELYLNDTRLRWTSHTEPLRPENAAEKQAYQAEMRCDQPVHVKPGDVLRVMYTPEGGQMVLGPVRLYRPPAEGGIVKLGVNDWSTPTSFWLVAKWEDTQRAGDTIRQPCLARSVFFGAPNFRMASSPM